MRIERLELERFRNYKCQAENFDSQCNVIYGENAQGKTNLLEAIFYLSCGKSPRAKTDREMIEFCSSSARLLAKVISRGREFQVQADIFSGRRRKFTVNQVPVKTAAALGDIYHTVLFQPEDLHLIREGAAARRRFMDMALCRLRPRYASALAGYERAREQKARILRDYKERPDLLEALPEFNEQMIYLGALVIQYRCQFSLRLGEYASLHHRECSGGKETLEVQYKTVSTVENPGADIGILTDQLRRHMENHKEAELASRLCLSGPHKDDILVKIDGREAKTYSSQGQTRTAALALKLAEREIYRNAAGEYPILLLDDVLSELDPRRQEFVLNRIAGGQVFITCCEEDRLPDLLGGKVFHVEQGKIV